MGEPNLPRLASQYSVLEGPPRRVIDPRDKIFNQKIGIRKAAKEVFAFRENNLGLKLSGPPQDYRQLLQYHLSNHTLFEDDTFDPANIELGAAKKDDLERIQWKRPFDFIRDPKFVVDGISRFDVEQGRLGDCWFLAALANLTQNEELFSYVVNKDQTFSRNGYAGIFHFRFWQYGKWVDVVIDDRLPTLDGELLYLKSSNSQEFWTPLLEKAYAKLYGSYKNIEGGFIAEAMEDLSGGLSEYYPVTGDIDLYEIMLSSYEMSSFIGVSIISNNAPEYMRDDGLVELHAYSVTKVAPIPTIDQEEKLLIRIRNPWGGPVEWRGRWNDRSLEWNSVTPQVRGEFLTRKNDGEFWMEFRDFQEKFTGVDICHLNPGMLLDGDDVGKRWHITYFEGIWVSHVTAGGGKNFKETFASNPQYFITVKGDRSNKYALVLSLMQKDRRKFGFDQLPLTLALYAVDTPAGQLLDKEFFENNEPQNYLEMDAYRQLTGRFLLPIGRYCIIPCTKYPNTSGEFLLRVYSEMGSDVIENDDEMDYDATQVDGETHESAVQAVDRTFPKLFRKFSGNQKEVGWDKVRKVLNQVYRKPAPACCGKPKKAFSESICRNIVSLWDRNYSGKLDKDEFWNVMKDVTFLHMIFNKYDLNRSGNLDGFELRKLLGDCGYKVNKIVLSIIMQRYGTDGTMSFENFVVAVFKLKAMMDEYQGRKSVGNEDTIQINKEDWLKTTLYN